MEKQVRILIVEDEALAAMTMQTVFQSWGYDVCKPVATGMDAIHSVEREEPDLVVFDINLVGEMNGIEAAKRIRAFSKTQFIFITGYSDKKLKEQASKLNPLAYLIKPILPKRLKIQMDQAFGRPGQEG